MSDLPGLRLETDGFLDGFSACAIPLIEGMCGISFSAEDADAPVIYYGNNVTHPCILRIPRIDGYRESSVPGFPEIDRSPSQDGLFPFDLFSAIRFWLADEGNADAPAEAWDAHDRLLPEKSAQHRLGALSIPLVNAYLLAFRRQLELRLGRKLKNRLLPPGKRAIVVLSHDVDNPFDPGDVGHFFLLAKLGLKNRRFGPAARQGLNMLRAAYSRVRAPDDRHWLFDEIVAAEARHGFVSTFFFAVTSPVAKAGHSLDVLYEIDQPQLHDVFQRLSSAGIEIGLHASYRARDDLCRIARERKRLESASGVHVLGNRHHYWHMGRPFWDMLAAHAEAGLRYDTSVAFNSLPGYRLSVALPFKPWHPATGKIIDSLQIPCMTMDSALCDRPGRLPAEAIDEFAGLLTTLKECEGIAAIDWHVRTSLPRSRSYAAWGETYLGILEILAGDQEVAVRRAGDLLD